MGRAAIFAAALFLCSTAAHATGSFDCSIDDANLKFDAQSAFSHGMGEQFVNFRAEAEVLGKGTPPSLKALKLDGALVHGWLFGGELKLRFYFETNEEPQASVEIVIETRSPDEDGTDYVGAYKLIILVANGEQKVFNGKVSCSVG